MSVIDKSTHGYTPVVRANRSPSPSTTGMSVGDSEDFRNQPANEPTISEMQSQAQKLTPTAEQNQGITVPSILPVAIKRSVGVKSLEGSDSGTDNRVQSDFAKSAVDEIANAKGVRARVGQFRDNSRLPDGPPPTDFVIGTDDCDLNS
jgi:hypothetical protein